MALATTGRGLDSHVRGAGRLSCGIRAYPASTDPYPSFSISSRHSRNRIALSVSNTDEVCVCARLSRFRQISVGQACLDEAVDCSCWIAALPMPSQSEGKRRLATQEVPVKRFRVSRACDQCRTAREKCDGNQPTCMPCFELKRSCTYTSNPRKRGLQPGYIRSLETTLAFVFQQSSEIEALVNKQLAQENTILLARGTKESNQLHKSWRKSKFCRDVTKALAGEQISLKEERLPSSDDESEVDVEDASLFHTLPSAQPQEEVSYSFVVVQYALTMSRNRTLGQVIQVLFRNI